MKGRTLAPPGRAAVSRCVPSGYAPERSPAACWTREGNPVPGARVYWTASRTEEEALADDTAGVDPKAVGETQTGADGTFHATLAAQPGAVAVRVEAAGLPGAVLTGPYDAADANVLPDVELPAAVKLAGKVVDESGKPVPGARVRVSGRGLLDADVGLLASAVSGPDGGFSIPNAPGGFRSVEVRAAGFAPAVRPLSDSAGDERVVLKIGRDDRRRRPLGCGQAGGRGDRLERIGGGSGRRGRKVQAHRRAGRDARGRGASAPTKPCARTA